MKSHKLYELYKFVKKILDINCFIFHIVRKLKFLEQYCISNDQIYLNLLLLNRTLIFFMHSEIILILCINLTYFTCNSIVIVIK